jgi:hypothetical protein
MQSNRRRIRFSPAIAGWLLDHPRRPHQHDRWNRLAESLGGFEIDHEFETHRLLDRQIGGFGSLEDSIDVVSHALVALALVASAGHQASAGDKFSPVGHRRQPMSCHQLRNPIKVRIVNRSRCHGQRGATGLRPLFERALELVGAAYLHGMKLQTQFSCRQLACLPLWRRASSPWVPRHCNTGEFGNGFFQQLQPFDGQLVEDTADPREVPARPREAATSPAVTGSAPLLKTRGIVLVAFFAAYAEGVDIATITSTLRRTNSSARVGRRSILPCADRYSMKMFLPST